MRILYVFVAVCLSAFAARRRHDRLQEAILPVAVAVGHPQLFTHNAIPREQTAPAGTEEVIRIGGGSLLQHPVVEAQIDPFIPNGTRLYILTLITGPRVATQASETTS